MKKIEKVWPEYLKTKPDNGEKQVARRIIAQPYKDFDDAYHRGIEMFKYEDWKVDLLIDVLECTLWDLFEDIDEPTEEEYRKMDEEARRGVVKIAEDKELTLTEQDKKDWDEMKKEELVTHPARYTGKSGMQVFDIINEYGMDFYEGNALKYLIRYKKKNGLEDLKKCRDYLDYMIAGYME